MFFQRSRHPGNDTVRGFTIGQVDPLRKNRARHPPLSVPADKIYFTYAEAQSREQARQNRSGDFVVCPRAAETDEEQQQWTVGTVRSDPLNREKMLKRILVVDVARAAIQRK